MKGERVDNHDRVCCEYYSQLLELGAYDVEFMLFGTVYLEKGKKKCFISAKRHVVYQFVEECRTKGIYPTMVQRKILRCRVNSGEREQVEQNFKLDFARQLNTMYSKEFLVELQRLANTQANNDAKEIFELLRNQLSGCFDEDALALFEGAVLHAFEGKVLAWEEYYRNMQWLEVERDFLTDKVRASSNFKRTFAGFAYIEYGKVKYYTNAVVEKTQERRAELMAKQLLTTPVYCKSYYFNDLSELQQQIDAFNKHAGEKLDNGYMLLIQTLYQLKPDIAENNYRNLKERCVEIYNQRERETFCYYETMWHLA